MSSCSHSHGHATANEYALDQPGRLDPTKTTSYQRDLARFLRGRIAELDAEIQRKLVEEDAFGIKETGSGIGEWAGLSDAEKGRRFDDWLDRQIEALVLAPIMEADRVERDLRRAAERGLKDARSSVRSAARLPVDDGGLTQSERQTLERGLPDPDDRITDRAVQEELDFRREELRQRTDAQLEEFAGEARQLAMAGLSAGIGASTIARDIVERGQVAKSKATASASAEIVNTFNTTKVRHYWDEVEADFEIEVEAEHVDAGDDRVCDTCLDISSMDWTFEDAAEGTPPRQPTPDDSFQYDTGPPWHDFCRCTFHVTQIGEVF